MQIKGYNTKQKNIIVDMLKKNKNRHLTADEMLKILDEMDSHVSKATLYRFLDVLVSTGDLRKYITLEGEKLWMLKNIPVVKCIIFLSGLLN